MDMMETIELEDLKAQARQVLEELMEAARLKPGQILVVGCSSSEIDSFKIGSHSSAEIGMAVYTALYQELKPMLRTFKPCPDSGGRGSSGLRL